MPSSNNINSETLVSRTKVYLIIIAILLIVLCFFQVYAIIPSIILYAGILAYTYWTNKKRKAELSEKLKDLTFNVNTAAKTTLINSPFPLVIIETNGNVIWKSEKFLQEFANVAIQESLTEILKELEISIEENKKERGSIQSQITISDKSYKVVGEYVKSGKNSHAKENIYMTSLYFIDVTEKLALEKQIEESKICIGLMMIDNYEELVQRVSEEERPQLIASIEKSIYEWVSNFEGFAIKSDRDTFYCIVEQKYLNEMEEQKFSILDTVKEIDTFDKIQPTLTIAFSNDGENNYEKAKSAKAVSDIALGRGGDQAITKMDGKYSFFGGRTQELEKRTKVKARTVSHALEELIQESSNVIIMGHANGDMDSVGSALGIYRLAKTLGKDGYVVNDTTGIGLDKFIEVAKQEEEYEKAIIGKAEALALINSDTLLIIVDTHKQSYVEVPELLEKTSKIVIIDHHRRSTDYIQNAMITFHEVYASSTAELVTEILEYSQKEVELTTIEVEALYAGIMLDTKNFTFKTGVRTFEAAAYLRKCGVDIIKVKKWFQSDLDTYKLVSDIVSEAEIVNDNIAISVYEEENKDTNIIVAKAADELLTIGGITASFVLGRQDNKVYISGRSIGDINVQLILEKLGGGGHITLAGAQIEGASLEEAKQELINRINEYFYEIEN